MTALLESLTWWPWPTKTGPIRNVSTAPEAPGMVTLRWNTPDPAPTRLRRADGSMLYEDGASRSDHMVTLTGWAGVREDIVIEAGEAEQEVEVAF